MTNVNILKNNLGICYIIYLFFKACALFSLNESGIYLEEVIVLYFM